MQFPEAALSERFESNAVIWEAGGATLYARLGRLIARALVTDDGADDLFRRALDPFEAEPAERLFPTRLMGGAHYWVLAGEEPELAMFYPSVGGFPDAITSRGLWPAFRDAVVARAEFLPTLLAGAVQHNEIGRAAPLAGGMLTVAAATGMRLRLLEVGSSAGLLLRMDQYLDRPWCQVPVAPDFRPLVVERLGCDLHPLSPFTDEGLLTLRSYVWADLTRNLEMLDEAVTISRRVHARVEESDGAVWLDEMLSEPSPGSATIVFHSMISPWASADSLARMERIIAVAGSEATSQAPLAWLRLEVDDPRAPAHRMAQARLTTWPGGHKSLIAECGINGENVAWSADVLAAV